MLDSGATLPGLGEKTSTSSPAPHSSANEQDSNMEQKIAPVSSDTASTVDQETEDIEKAKLEENSENDTKERKETLGIYVMDHWCTSLLHTYPSVPWV